MYSASSFANDRRRSAAPVGSIVDFVRLLWTVSHELERMSAHMETSLGVTAQGWLVVRLVGRYPGVSAGAVAELLHLDPSSLTPVIKRLRRRGLLERRSDPRDRRRVLLGLTAAGRAVDVPLEHTVEASIDRALAGVPSSAVTAAKDVMASVLRQLALDAASVSAPPAGRRASMARRRRHEPG